MKTKTFLIFLLGAMSLQLAAQPLLIDTTQTGNLSYLESMIESPGNNVFNVEYFGNPMSIGYFQRNPAITPPNFPLKSGLVLTTGKATDAAGPNNNNAVSYASMYGGHPVFDSLSTLPIVDACVLEFDFTSNDTVFTQRYIFGSEEYLEFVDSANNDLVRICISGPNPDGGQYVNKVISLIPGTQIPVGINSLNSTTNNLYYFNNGTGAVPNNQAVQYDGYSVPLWAFANIVPGAVYHITIGVAEIWSRQRDSGIILDCSFGGNCGGYIMNLVGFDSGNNIYEGNTYYLRFEKSFSFDPYQNFPVFLDISGDATSGVDFLMIPDTVIIPFGSYAISIPLLIYADGIMENPESLIISSHTMCDSTNYTISRLIQDEFVLDAGIDLDSVTICHGKSILISTSVNVSNYTFDYEWSNGSSYSFLTLTGGNTTNAVYYVTISSNNWPSVVDSIQVFVTPAMNLQMELYTDTCQLDAAQVIVLGGLSPYTYQWSTGDTTSMVTGLTIGGKHVTVTDAYSCSKVGHVYPSPGPITLAANVSYQCNTNLGAIQLETSGGYSPLSYIWSNGYTASYLGSLYPGVYDISVYDIYGCNDAISVEIDTVPLSATINYSTAGCSPGIAEVEVIGGNPPYSLYWGSGSSQYWYYNQPGTYYITITDSHFCTYVDSFVFVENPATFLSFSDTIIYNCNPNSGDINITIQNGIPPYTYAWSNGDTTEDLLMAPPGHYSVTVIDGNYCYRSDHWEIKDYSQPYVNESAKKISDCTNLNNGGLYVSAWNGTLPFHFLWSTGDTTQLISNLVPGTYSYTVTDGCNLELTNSFNLEYQFSVDYEIEKINPSCNSSDGWIHVYTRDTALVDSIWLVETASGQVFIPVSLPASYGLSYNFYSMEEGDYILHFVDTFLCADSAEISLGQIADFVAASPAMTTIDCPGDEVTLTASFANPEDYLIKGIGFDTIPVSSQAVQIAPINDDNSYGPFSMGFDFTFFNNPYSEFYIGSNGWISFKPNPGSSDPWNTEAIPNPDIHYPHAAIMPAYRDWNPTMFQGISGIYYEYTGTAPNRKVVVTWKNISLFSCTGVHGDFQVVLYENGNMFDINLSNVPNCEGWNFGRGVCGIQNETGTTAYTIPGRNNTLWEAENETWRFYPALIDWYNSSNVLLGSGMEITVNPETSVIYHTQYNSPCGVETDYVEIILNNPALSTKISPELICEGQDMTISLPGWDYYYWDNGASTESIQIPGAGSYSVSVASGICNWSTEASIGYEENTNEYPYSPYVCEGDTLYFQLEPDYHYLWFDGSLDSSYVITTSGNYHVTVSSANCTWHDSIDVLLRALPLGILPSDTTMCLNYTFEIGAGATSYSYIWNNGSSNVVLITDTAGLFVVDKSDAYGCSITDSVSITYQPDVISAFQFFEAFNHVNFINQSQDAYYYFWDFGDGSPISNEANPEHDYPVLNQNMWYTATLISANQCGSDTSSMQIFTFDIEEMEGESPISIFPNPNQGNFFLSGSLESKGDLKLSVFNSTGQEIYRTEISSSKGKISEEIGLGHVAPGLYYLRIQQKENKWVWKMVVK